MKYTYLKTLAALTAFILFNTAYSQAPEGVNYQAIARDANGKLLANKNISVKCVIMKGASASNAVYSETHSITTNAFGHFSVVIGKGSTTDDFSTINWGSDRHHLKVEVDNGSGYSVIGTTEFQSVPYALHSKTAENVSNLKIGLNDIDDVSTTGVTNGQVLKWDGSKWAPAADQSGSGGSLVAGTGITITGNTIDASNGTAMWNADKIYGNKVKFGVPTTGDVLTWDGSQWITQAPEKYTAGSGISLTGNSFSAKNSDGIWNASQFMGKDYDPTGLSSGYTMSYDGTKWVAKKPNTYDAGTGLTLSGSTFNAQNTNGIWNANKFLGTDYDSTGLRSGYVMTFDGAKWTPKKTALLTPGYGIKISNDSIIADALNPIWNANMLQGKEVASTNPGDKSLLQYRSNKWTPTSLDSFGLWNKVGNNINYDQGNVGIGNDVPTPFVKLHVQDSSLVTTAVITRMVDNYFKANPSTNPWYIGQRTVVFGNGGSIHTGTQSIAAGTGSSTSSFVGAYNQANGTGRTNSATQSIVTEGATVQSTGLLANTRATSTFNLGVIASADQANSNTNYAIYAIADSAATNYAGYFIGNVNYTGTLTNVSDRKLKTDVKGLMNATDLVMKLQPKTYTYLQNDYTATLNLSKGLQYGFIAQELEEVFPQLVKNQVHMKGIENPEKMEYKAVNYIGLIPILTQTIKEQQTTIESLEARLKALEDKMK